jgi:Fe-S-cluster containining protein
MNFMNEEHKNNDNTESKQKFSFNCTQCGNCCSDRGPIPIVLIDILNWAKNEIISTTIPYLKFIRTEFGTIDLVLDRKKTNPYDFLEPKSEKTEPQDEDRSCPFFNNEKKDCLIYSNRPLSCQTYPLEFDGSKFMVVDAENCLGIGEGTSTKEELKEMRNLAKGMHNELTKMRITMPILSQTLQPFVLQEILKSQQQYMNELEKMSPEEREKFEEQMKSQMDNTKKTD